jgi:hypothetical protein
MRRSFDKELDALLMSLLVIAVMLCIGQSAWARVAADKLRIPGADKTQIVTLQDGSVLTGRITKIEADNVNFSSTVGELSISVDQIGDIREVSSSSFKSGKYWFKNPNQTRLYIAPTGRTLEAGTGYFSDIWVFFPSVSFGITNNIAVGGGVSLFPGVDLADQLFYVFPKVGLAVSDRVAIAGSVLIVRIPNAGDEIDEPKTAGILFGTCTVGSEDNSLTFGLGHGYAGSDFAEKPAVLLGGEYRFSRRLSFVSENWIFPGADQPLISYGVRFIGQSISVDLAFINVAGDDAIFPGVPFLSFVWNF